MIMEKDDVKIAAVGGGGRYAKDHFVLMAVNRNFIGAEAW